MNVPNLLGFLRLLLAPTAVYLIVGGQLRTALLVFFLAAVTDAIDGPIARRFGCITRFGTFLDPIADKALLSSGYIALGAANFVPWWLVAVVFGRDLFILAMVGLALLFTTRRDFPPSRWGKLSTVIQAGGGVLILASHAYSFFIPIPMVLATVAAATIWSGCVYAATAVAVLRSRSAQLSQG